MHHSSVQSHSLQYHLWHTAERNRNINLLTNLARYLGYFKYCSIVSNNLYSTTCKLCRNTFKVIVCKCTYFSSSITLNPLPDLIVATIVANTPSLNIDSIPSPDSSLNRNTIAPSSIEVSKLLSLTITSPYSTSVHSILMNHKSMRSHSLQYHLLVLL